MLTNQIPKPKIEPIPKISPPKPINQNNDITTNLTQDIISALNSQKNKIDIVEFNIKGQKLILYPQIAQNLSAKERTNTIKSIQESLINTLSNRDYLANFQNGTYIEGFVKYTPVGEAESEENPSLTMPYLGFYGDYSKADAVEPFSFEKDTIYDRVNGTKDENGNTVGRLYGSDLVNYVGSHSYSLRSIDVGSGISMDSFDNYQKNDRRTAVLKNDNNLYSFGKEIVNKK